MPDTSLPDTGVADTGLSCADMDWPMTAECCEAFGGFWDEGGGCGVPGPFVPPAMMG